MSTLDALFQQRRADGDFGGLGGAVLAPCGTDAEQRRAGTAQNGVDIVEVDMNVRVGGDQIGDALHTCQECGVGGLEASTMPIVRSDSSSSRSLGITISASTSLRRFSMLEQRKPHAEVLRS